jgi:hypothetical protein
MDKPSIPTLLQLLDKAKSFVAEQRQGSAGFLAEALDMQQKLESVAEQKTEPNRRLEDRSV